jgi:hypothetical protein
MMMCKNSVRRWSKVRLLAVVWIGLLSFSNAGCGKRVSYVNGGHSLTKVVKGQPAPQDGVLMSEEYLSQIYEALGGKPACAP